jgi:allophanate hydrolase
MNFDLDSLRAGYREGQFSPVEVVREAWKRIRERGERPVWIHLIPEEESIARAEALGPYRDDLPLYGVPFAIKDNIDLAGVPTTAGCPDYAYIPNESATVVARLIAAGAILIGKTNLDQFATGLVGTRSPYGACSSVFDDLYISGGSSSGSAVAVAANLVAFSLGTDTAGSGRVPAAFNGIVGLKPTRGALSTKGVVPACRTLDCVSIFALNCGDAARVFDAANGFDPADPYSRRMGQQKSWPHEGFRFGVPSDEQLRFFEDELSATAFQNAGRCMEAAGGVRVPVNYGLFNDAANLLYSGPWVAERLAAIQGFLAQHPDSLHPVTARIIKGASGITATDTFKAIYRLDEIRRASESAWQQMDFMLLPTAGTHYTHAEVEAEPISTNTNLGYYTNFVNLLDLAAIAVPAGHRGKGMPFGVSLIGPAWSEEALLQTADLLGGVPARSSLTKPYCPAGYVPLAVCGAHLSGEPLNHQLLDAGAFLIEACRTSAEYRFYALQGTVPAKPGLVYSPSGGNSIEVEVWAVPENTFGAFVAMVPQPLGIGTCTLETGRKVKSFICEPYALGRAEEITELASWRAFRRKQS